MHFAVGAGGSVGNASVCRKHTARENWMGIQVTSPK